MLNAKQSRTLDEVIGLHAKSNASIEIFVEELILGMDEQYLDSFLKDFMMDKDDIDAYGGKSFKGAVHYAKPYINKSIKAEIGDTLYTITNLRNGLFNGIEYDDKEYNISFKGVQLMTRHDFNESMGYGYYFIPEMEAKLKEIALAERGVKNIGDTLSNPEPILALENN